MKLVLVKSDSSDDWYTIEKAEHEHRGWLEKTASNVMSFRWSGRISDADVEGTRSEMLELADAILKGGEYQAYRCAVEARGDLALFWSPRNSVMRGIVPLHEAIELAFEIRRMLVPKDEKDETLR